MLHLGARAERRERAQERLLDDVLGPPVRTQSSRVRVKLRAVALDDHGKRPIVARAGEAHQSLVGL
jgi:hypothetical protein